MSKSQQVQAEIFEILEKAKRTSSSVSKTSNLFFDLGFDSLAYVKLLLDLEKRFGVQFSIAEMEDCLVAKNIVACIEKKLGKQNGV